MSRFLFACLVGTLVVTLLTMLPMIAMCNCCCCMWDVLGGFLAVLVWSMMSRRASFMMAAAIGISVGVASSLSTGILSTAWTALAPKQASRNPEVTRAWESYPLDKPVGFDGFVAMGRGLPGLGDKLDQAVASRAKLTDAERAQQDAFLAHLDTGFKALRRGDLRAWAVVALVMVLFTMLVRVPMVGVGAMLAWMVYEPPAAAPPAPPPATPPSPGTAPTPTS